MAFIPTPLAHSGGVLEAVEGRGGGGAGEAPSMSSAMALTYGFSRRSAELLPTPVPVGVMPHTPLFRSYRPCRLVIGGRGSSGSLSQESPNPDQSGASSTSD